mgnify:CR=1 FL=1
MGCTVRSKWSLGSVGGKERLECDAVVLFIYLKIHDKITKKPVFNNKLPTRQTHTEEEGAAAVETVLAGRLCASR